MPKDNLTVVVEIDRRTGRKHLSIKLEEFRWVLVSPVCQTWDASNEVKSIVECIHDLLLREFTFRNPCDFLITFCKIVQSLIHSLKLFASHERNDAIFTH